MKCDYTRSFAEPVYEMKRAAPSVVRRSVFLREIANWSVR